MSKAVIVKFEEGALWNVFFVLLGLVLLVMGLYFSEAFFHTMYNQKASNDVFLSNGFGALVGIIFGILFLYAGFKKE